MGEIRAELKENNFITRIFHKTCISLEKSVPTLGIFYFLYQIDICIFLRYNRENCGEKHTTNDEQ